MGEEMMVSGTARRVEEITWEPFTAEDGSELVRCVNEFGVEWFLSAELFYSQYEMVEDHE